MLFIVTKKARNVLRRIKRDLVVAGHTEKVKKQREMPLPILSPIPFLKYFKRWSTTCNYFASDVKVSLYIGN